MGRHLLSTRCYRKQKAGENGFEQEDTLQSQEAEELGSFSHMVLALESRKQNRVVESPSEAKESC